MISKRAVQTFQRHVYAHYDKNSRDFPWRRTKDPYRILVSEIMLQQTQVDRVVPKYRAFLKKFPTMRSLASASLRDVLALWQGLGYNRRALSLHALAKIIDEKYHGRIPRSEPELKQLPGVGPYTAAAIIVFAHNQPTVLIETNIRTAYLHHFFENQTGISDVELSSFVEATLDRENPQKWYQALMDYGSMLKRTVGNASQRSKHYKRQSKFTGSARELRGAIVRLLVSKPALSLSSIARHAKRNKTEVSTELEQLAREGMVVKKERVFELV